MGTQIRVAAIPRNRVEGWVQPTGRLSEVPVVESRGRIGPVGIFPFRLGRQSVSVTGSHILNDMTSIILQGDSPTDPSFAYRYVVAA